MTAGLAFFTFHHSQGLALFFSFNDHVGVGLTWTIQFCSYDILLVQLVVTDRDGLYTV